jgi:hypothetical protein
MTISEVSNKLYQYIKKANDECKLRPTAKGFLALEEINVIKNAFKYLQDQTDTTVQESYRSFRVCGEVFKQAVEKAQANASYTLEEAYDIYSVLVKLVELLNEKIKEEEQPVHKPKRKAKVPPKIVEEETDDDGEYDL